MTNIIANAPNRFKLYAAGAALAALVIAVLAVTFATASAQAQEDTNANDGKYDNPQPCGQNVADVPANPVGEFSEGHVALFDAYWDYETQTINNNLCPPLAVHTVKTVGRGQKRVDTSRAESNIDVNETVFHAGNEFQYTITAADEAKYPFLPPAGTQVWWLKQDDPIAEAQEPEGEEEPELVLGISAGLFKEDDWYREDSHGNEVEPLQYEFEAERDSEGRVAPFVVFANGATEPVWDSRDADSTAIPIKPGEYKHYNWMFFPGTDSHTYVLEVHVKGHVRTVPAPPGFTVGKWQPLTWPTKAGTPAYDPDTGGDAFNKTLNEIEKAITSEVRKERYTIQVGGDLTLVDPPMFQVERSVEEGSEKDTNVGDPVAVHNPDGRDLTFSLAGDGADKFSVAPVDGGAQVKVNEAAGLDYEGKPSYGLILEVSDGRDRENNPDPSIDHRIALKVNLIDIDFSTHLSATVSDSSPAVNENVTVTVTMHNPPANMHNGFSIYMTRTKGSQQYDIDPVSYDRNARNPTATFTLSENRTGTVYYSPGATMWITTGGGHDEFVAGGDFTITWGN